MRLRKGFGGFVFGLFFGVMVSSTGLANEAGGELSAPMKTVFQGYGGDTVYEGPRNGAVESLVGAHLRSWVACEPKGYIQTVGGFIYDRLGGQTSAQAMRDGLESRYPGNPIARVVLLRVDGMGKGKAEALYEAHHKDGTSVQRVLHIEMTQKGWRVVRVSKVR